MKDDDQSLKPLTTQSIFKKLYEDKAVLALQTALALAILIDFVFYDSLLKANTGWFVASMSLSLVFFAVPKLPFNRLAQSYIVNVAFHVLTAVFMILIAPVGSPYELLFILLIYVSSYWHGTKGFVFSYLTVSLTLWLAWLHQLPNATEGETHSLVVKLVVLGTIGAMLDRMHALDLKERQQLISVSRQASYERERLRSLINSMADAVIATDYDGKVLVYNGATLDLLNTNLTLEDQPLQRFLKTYSKAHRPIDLLAQARESQTIVKRDDILLKVNKDEYLNLYASVAQIHLGYGERGEEGFILLLRDVTKEKSIEEQRDEFISVVSHELRTPIAIAEANVSTALLPNMVKDHAKVAELLEQAHKNVLFLADLVNDITTLAHAERGDLDAEIEDVDPGALVREIAESHRQEVGSKGLKLKTVVAVGLPPSVRSNSYRLKEILTDFVTNALKYTDKGSITLSVEPVESSGVRFAVTDTGIGISQSDQHHVFSKFWRSEDYRTRVHSGTGLGLYIAKKLAERMHGTVGVQSKLNKGSTFYLEIPLELPEDQSGNGGK